MTDADRQPQFGGDKTCARCGAPFRCGPVNDGERCWCDALPHIAPSQAWADCLCPTCLAGAVSAARTGAG
jgi:hypothetical protein